MLSPPFRPVIVVLGPTGSGKSELALCIAKHVQGEIINCDSIQVYRGLDIGSAKTTPQDRQGVPHHLLDVIGPGEEISAGSYAQLARENIADIQSRGMVPIVVGGTGFYLRALLDGLSPAPGRNALLRQRLSKIANRRPAFLHRVLNRYDGAAAARIHPNDTPKLIRAIEITLLTGKAVTDAQAAPRLSLSGISMLKLGLDPDRKLLHRRLNQRAEWMFKNGLLEETRGLVESGYEASSKPLQSLGYKHALAVISGEQSFDSALLDCQTKTRQYAKRQMTWFRREPEVVWMHGFGDDAQVQEKCISIIAAKSGNRQQT